MDMEAMARKLMAGAGGDSLRALASSPTGSQLASRLDGASLEEALRSGDETALRGMLQGVLDTPEGRHFAAQVMEAVNGRGR